MQMAKVNKHFLEMYRIHVLADENQKLFWWSDMHESLVSCMSLIQLFEQVKKDVELLTLSLNKHYTS